MAVSRPTASNLPDNKLSALERLAVSAEILPAKVVVSIRTAASYAAFAARFATSPLMLSWPIPPVLNIGFASKVFMPVIYSEPARWTIALSVAFEFTSVLKVAVAEATLLSLADKAPSALPRVFISCARSEVRVVVSAATALSWAEFTFESSEPFKAGRRPLPSSRTSWPGLLKVFPCRVTLEPSALKLLPARCRLCSSAV